MITYFRYMKQYIFETISSDTLNTILHLTAAICIHVPFYYKYISFSLVCTYILLQFKNEVGLYASDIFKLG